jgi:hypothetical protein
LPVDPPVEREQKPLKNRGVECHDSASS